MSTSELITLVDTKSFGTLLVLVFLYIVLNASFGPWLDIFEKVRNRKIQDPQDFLNGADEVSSETRTLLRDVSEARMLQRTIGIYAEHKLRGPLYELYLETSHEVDLRTLRQAWPDLEMRDGQLRVARTQGLRRVLWLGNLLFAAITLIFLVLCLSAALYLFVAEPFEQANLYATVFGLYLVPLVLMLQAPGYVIRAGFAARRIEKDLMKGSATSDAQRSPMNSIEGEADYPTSTTPKTSVTRRLRGSMGPRNDASEAEHEWQRHLEDKYR